MKHLPAFGLVLGLAVACAPSPGAPTEAQAWEARAAGIEILRDDWGVAHVYGATDADAVFGAIYAQAEDDFHRIEVNYLNAMGRLAEAEGEAAVFRDLRMKLFIDPGRLQEQYRESPEWLRELMDAWADGLNWFLYKHPEITPRVIDRFEPWMALSFSEGSIGGDIERISLAGLEAFYGQDVAVTEPVAAGGSLEPPLDPLAEPRGSNGIAIAPARTVDGHALLLINPHTSFYFRSELHMVSNEGLDAYGAATWGQFFIYQGFNATAGWMHTSSGADAIDEYAYEVTADADGSFYPYGDERRRMQESVITVPYRTDAGMAAREFRVYRSHHGPIVRRQDDGRWIAVKLMQEPINALMQSYSRTRARNYEEFKQTMELHTNSSNNTVFADAEGNVAYFHANFVPIRDPRFDFSRPVDGSDPATEWQGITPVDASPNALNPAGGWIQNTNNWPYSVAGASSPRREDHPAYMDTAGENPRGLHAIRLLDGPARFTIDTLVDAAYDSHLTAFEQLVPALLRAYAATPDDDPLKAPLAEQIELLRAWDLRSGVDSQATTLAIFWGDELMRRVAPAARAADEEGVSIYGYMATRASAREHLEALAAAAETLAADFGSWQVPWGEANRFQRLSGDIDQRFDDEAPSLPVGFASGRWGSLASFGTVKRGTRKLYGTSGNSFVAVVEFGDVVRARAVTAGGLSGDPDSPHFNDQAERYASGNLRPVYFYRRDVEAAAERSYHPGQ